LETSGAYRGWQGARERPFKGRQFKAEVILWAVRRYLQFPVSYLDLDLMLRDRGVRFCQISGQLAESARRG